VAKRDYRDVLARAEYPNEMQRSMSEMVKMPPEQAKRIRGQDREQYLEWLNSED
jgi:hypothetical protein